MIYKSNMQKYPKNIPSNFVPGHPGGPRHPPPLTGGLTGYDAYRRRNEEGKALARDCVAPDRPGLAGRRFPVRLQQRRGLDGHSRDLTERRRDQLHRQ